MNCFQVEDQAHAQYQIPSQDVHRLLVAGLMICVPLERNVVSSQTAPKNVSKLTKAYHRPHRLFQIVSNVSTRTANIVEWIAKNFPVKSVAI